MTLRAAVAIGIATGLAITTATTWRPQSNTPPIRPTKQPYTPAQINLIPNPAPTPNDPLPTITVDGKTYGVSPYASPIPCWFVGGKAVCINGTVSDLSN